jgi:hypothetical protein
MVVRYPGGKQMQVDDCSSQLLSLELPLALPLLPFQNMEA